MPHLAGNFLIWLTLTPNRRIKAECVYVQKHGKLACLTARQHVGVGGGGFEPLTEGKQAVMPSLFIPQMLKADTMPSCTAKHNNNIVTRANL